MKRSKSKVQWEGFKPIEYLLDLKVMELPLKKPVVVNGKSEEVPTTVGEIYEGAREQSKLEGFWDATIKMSNGDELIIKGPSFSRDILRTMLGLRADGINPFATTWFWY